MIPRHARFAPWTVPFLLLAAVPPTVVSHEANAGEKAYSRGGHGTVQLAQLSATSGIDFEILRDTDLPGNDFADPWRNRDMSGISLTQCRNACSGVPSCRAFTYNTRARACFLKGAVGRPKSFRGAISGFRVEGSDAGQGQAFDILRDTDLPGGDFRTGFEERGLRAIPLSVCQQACLKEPRCAAFTYNARARVCFLKSTVASRQRFTGAISGLKQQRGRGGADLAYRPRETEDEHVARIRDAAIGYGGSCTGERTAIERLAAETAVTAKSGYVAAGGRLTLSWKRSTAVTAGSSAPVPAYLMISADRPVRFAGEGFYALMPGARAPFGINAFRSGTRAVVPLYGDDVPEGGMIDLTPLLAGELNIEWAVVGYLRKCREGVTGAAMEITIAVESVNTPTIVLQEEAEVSAPKARIGPPPSAPQTGRIIEVSDNGYRLVDEKTGGELAKRAGREPRFSPTGRFLVAESDDGIEVIDAVDGTLVHKDSLGGRPAWTNADSFLVIDRGQWGRIEIIAPAQVGRSVLAGNTACHVCGGTESGVRIDLENDLAVVSNDLGLAAARLGRAGALLADTWGENAADRGTLPSRIRSLFGTPQLAPFSLPTQWDIAGVIEFTHGSVGRFATDADEAPKLAGLPSRLVEQRVLPIDQVAGLSSGSTLEPAAWRGLARADGVPRQHRMVSRLAEFGIPIPEMDGRTPFVTVPELFELSGNKEGGYFDDTERAAMSKLVRRIKSEAGSAGDAIAAGPSVACDAAESHWNEATKVFTVLKIYGEFQRAFRFQVGDRVIWVTHRRCVQGSAAFSNPSLAVFDSRATSAHFIEQQTRDPDISYAGAEGRCHVNIADCDVQVRLFADRLLLLSSGASRAIVVFDIDAGKVVFKKFQLPHGDLLADALVTTDRRGVVQVNSDGTFNLYALEDARTLLEGRYVDDEIVVWTPDMHFDSTAEGAHFVNLKFPGQPGQYTFQQFDSRLRVVGLAQKVLAPDFRPDPVAVGVPPRLAGALTRAGGDRISGHATAVSSGNLREIRIYQDGVLTDSVPATRSGQSVAFDVARLPGARWASLVAVDEDGLASLPMGRDLGADKDAQSAMRVLAVGVNKYRSPAVPDLALAVADARTLSRSVAATGSNVRTNLMLDNEAAPGAILAAARDLVSGASRGDTIVFFFAGHGLKGPDGRFYMATSATDPKDIAGTALAWDDLARVLARTDARVVILLDACHSGTAGTDFFASNDDAASGILKNIPSGLVVFSASKGREFSLEDAKVGGGFFTTAVAEVIADDRARYDRNGNGAIEISELHAGVKRLVVHKTDGRQTPWLARNRMIGDFAVF